MDRTNLSQDALALTAGRLIGAVFALVGMMALARLLTRADYGLYLQVWLVYNTVLPFMMMGLPGGVTYFVPQMDRQGQKIVLLQTLSLLAVGGVITGAGTYLFADRIAQLLGGTGLAHLLRAFVWFPMLSFPLLAVDVFLVATHRARISAGLSVLSALIQFAAVVVPAWLGYDLSSVIATLTLATLAKLLLFQYIVFENHREVPATWDRSILRRQLAYCVPLGLAAVLSGLALQVDKLIVAGYFAPGRFAVYEVGARELPLVGIVTGSIMAVLTPEFVRLHARNERGSLVELWHAGTMRIAALFFPATAFLMIATPDLVPLLFSQRYIESVAIFQICLLLLPLRSTQYGALLMAAGRSRLVLGGSILGIVLKIVLNLALIPSFGLRGAAGATVLTVYAVAVWLMYHCTKVLQTSFPQLFPWGTLGKMAFWSAIPAVAAYASTTWMEQGTLRLGAMTFIYGVVALPCFWFSASMRHQLGTVFDTVLVSTGMRGYARARAATKPT